MREQDQWLGEPQFIFHSVAWPLDENGVAMGQQSIQDGWGDEVIPKDLTLLLKGFVSSHDVATLVENRLGP